MCALMEGSLVTVDVCGCVGSPAFAECLSRKTVGLRLVSRALVIASPKKENHIKSVLACSMKDRIS